AELIAARGWATYVPEADLTEGLLAETIGHCLGEPKPGTGRSIALAGAETSYRCLHQKFIGLRSG
ncbi:MAG: hypothetical protein AAF414_19805, partial [Pseudomonadota bacterium]